MSYALHITPTLFQSISNPVSLASFNLSSYVSVDQSILYIALGKFLTRTTGICVHDTFFHAMCPSFI